MKFKNLVFIMAVSAALAGCASGPDLSSAGELNVYADNRVGYMLTTNATTPVRVWSANDTILALRFGRRVINAKDLTRVVAYRTSAKYVPLHIDAQLKSGESLVGDVIDWGNSQYSNVIVEWLACSREKKCEVISPSATSKVSPPSNFLASINENRFEELGEPGAKLENYVTYESFIALPRSSDYRLNFTDLNKIMDMREGVELAKAQKVKRDNLAKVQKAKRDNCVVEAVAARNRWIKQAEKEIVSKSAPADAQRKLAQWRASLSNPTADLIGWEAGCNP